MQTKRIHFSSRIFSHAEAKVWTAISVGVLAIIVGLVKRLYRIGEKEYVSKIIAVWCSLLCSMLLLGNGIIMGYIYFARPDGIDDFGIYYAIRKAAVCMNFVIFIWISIMNLAAQARKPREHTQVVV